MVNFPDKFMADFGLPERVRSACGYRYIVNLGLGFCLVLALVLI